MSHSTPTSQIVAAADAEEVLDGPLIPAQPLPNPRRLRLPTELPLLRNPLRRPCLPPLDAPGRRAYLDPRPASHRLAAVHVHKRHPRWPLRRAARRDRAQPRTMRQTTAWPGSDSLPNLKVVEVSGHSEFLLPSIIKIRPPLRRLALGKEICDPRGHLAALLQAYPSITDLDLSSAREITDATLALLHEHPPLTALRLRGDYHRPRQTGITSDGLSNRLKRFLRVRGASLQLLDIADNAFTTHVDLLADLLGCVTRIGQTSPLLEHLRLRTVDDEYYGHYVPLTDIAFLEDLKRACPNLRYVGLGFCSVMRRQTMSEEVLQFLATLMLDVFVNDSMYPLKTPIHEFL
ncbi:hypothetical protein BDK51DRAFT_40915 [Blyttiomyces helicus]|uniref:Uncharacterized protein n=1 Tax=Blyttiomyces helicus TaxID=388810 RepID=A0A4V1IRG0_9FUNG|nr:hypothetical protein BDK51DRAFT_40915 [Blyttiomyces helicus]|eukprot:RKO89927.1 hypothetical protein BDK51DRAFT_40915 [Blyttiomyces helicus]